MSMQAKTWVDKGGFVLLVEDDPFYSEALKATLENSGFTTRQAETASDALAFLASGVVPDCIVTDLHMPGLNGFDLLRSVRQMAPLDTCPIIVLTGQDDTSDIEQAFRLGATSFLTKPVHPLILVHHVRLVRRAGRANPE